MIAKYSNVNQHLFFIYIIHIEKAYLHSLSNCIYKESKTPIQTNRWKTLCLSDKTSLLASHWIKRETKHHYT